MLKVFFPGCFKIEDANTSLLFGNVTINQAGVYSGCWCWSGFKGACSREDSSFYPLELNNVTIHGPVGFQPTRIAAGDPIELLLSGYGLSSKDLLRFVNGSCGTSAAELSSSDFEGEDTPEGLSRAWSNVTFMKYGSYQVCWCYMEPGQDCSKDEDADFTVGFLEVWGPMVEHHQCAMSDVCNVALLGVPSYESSSILLRSGSACDTSQSSLVLQGLTNPQKSPMFMFDRYSSLRFRPSRSRREKMVQLAELVFYFNGSRVAWCLDAFIMYCAIIGKRVLLNLMILDGMLCLQRFF